MMVVNEPEGHQSQLFFLNLLVKTVDFFSFWCTILYGEFWPFGNYITHYLRDFR